MRALHPCGTGCNGKRLTGSEYGNEKHTGEKIGPCITGRSAPYSAVVKEGWRKICGDRCSASDGVEAEFINQASHLMY